MWAYGLAELGRHKEHCEYLADTGESTGINLDNIDCVRLEKLLEHHPIMRVFPGGDANTVGRQFPSDASMAKDTIDTRQLRDTITLEKRGQGELHREGIEGRTHSSGAVGSSINQGLISASFFTYSIACGTSHT